MPGESFTSVIWSYNTFANNLEIEHKIAKYMMGSCCLSYDQHFSLKYFSLKCSYQKDIRKIIRTFFPCSGHERVNILPPRDWYSDINANTLKINDEDHPKKMFEEELTCCPQNTKRTVSSILIVDSKI